MTIELFVGCRLLLRNFNQILLQKVSHPTLQPATMKYLDVHCVLQLKYLMWCRIHLNNKNSHLPRTLNSATISVLCRAPPSPTAYWSPLKRIFMAVPMPWTCKCMDRFVKKLRVTTAILQTAIQRGLKKNGGMGTPTPKNQHTSIKRCWVLWEWSALRSTLFVLSPVGLTNDIILVPII